MANILADNADWLAEQLQYNAGTTVNLIRGGRTGTCVATIGQSPFESVDSNGVSTLTRSRDFLIAIGDYKLNDVAVEPQPHDIIVATVGGREIRHRTFEDATGRCFYIDQCGTRYRIHTKEAA